MNATVVRPRRTWLPALGLVSLVAWFGLALLLGGGGTGACRPPPPGYHSEPATWTYLWMFGPGALTFLVTAYLALGVRSVWVRWLLLVPCLGLAVAVTFVALIFMPFSCGMFVPN